MKCRQYQRVHALVHGLGALLFPAPCLVCERVLAEPFRSPVCRDCELSFPRIRAPGCPRCGLPYEDGVTPGLCGPCRGERHFELARSVAPYEGSIRVALHALKFGRRERVARTLGRMAAACLAESELGPFAAAVPVPLSRRRRRERGFNQAELLARTVASTCGLSLAHLLARSRDTRPQAELGRAARRRNVRGAFRVRMPRRLVGERLLVVDDIFTTGATSEACAEALLRAGAGAVDVLTVARVRQAGFEGQD